jgi:hypothetical protein
VGLVAAAYLGWALKRIDVVALGAQPRAWPYPDGWLVRWEQRLDAAHPVRPGYFKIEGELPRMQFYLGCWTGLSGLTALLSAGWLISRKDCRLAKPNLGPNS